MRVCLLRRAFVWLSRLHHSRGFGIQSPNDYAFVRYVVNEHWPYYAYERLDADCWLEQKLGRLYLRMANWRQPTQMERGPYDQWFAAGCRQTQFVERVDRVQLARVSACDRQQWSSLLDRCDEQSVLVVENICDDREAWRDIVRNQRTGTIFDLYYCGIVLFERKRYNHHYIINF